MLEPQKEIFWGKMSLTWSRGSARDVIGSRHTFLAMGCRKSSDSRVSEVSVRHLSRCSSATTQRAFDSTTPTGNSKLACFDRTNLDRVELWPRKPYFSPKEYDPNQILKKIGTECGPLSRGSVFISPYFSRFRLNYRRSRPIDV